MLKQLLFMAIGVIVWLLVGAVRKLHRQVVIDLALQDMTNEKDEES